MKIRHIIVGICLLTCTVGSAQLFAFEIRNTDRVTYRKLDRMIVDIGLIVGANVDMERQIRSARTNMVQMMDRDYTANPYDSNFVMATGFPALIAIAQGLIAYGFGLNTTPYYTATKQNYIDAANTQSLEMLGMAIISNTETRSSDRQVLYRIRKSMVRSHSRNQGQARRLMVMSAVAFAVVYSNKALLDFLRASEVVY